MSTALYFVDCSSNNPMPDLRAYKASGHDTILRKVSEGTVYHWFEGDTLTDQAHTLGLAVGHYHWLRPDQNPLDQADFFVSTVRGHLRAGDFLVTDFERTVGAGDPPDHLRAAQLHLFNAAVRKQLPGHPIYVYTGNWYLDGKPHCQEECRRWPVIMSDYSGAATLPNPHSLRYAAWQYTDRATVAGFSRPVDYNRWLQKPANPAKEFTVDAKAQAEFDAINKRLDALYGCFMGSDGHHHTVESAVAHVTQGAGYLSKKGHLWSRLFRKADVATPAPEVKK